jgi:hypothetical protein
VIRHDRNRGVAAAILTGSGLSETDVVCSMDADCTCDPHELGHMIPMLTDGVHMVTASPTTRRAPSATCPVAPGPVAGRLLPLSPCAFPALYTYTSCFRVYRR